ncbi:MAG: hypothetical protein JRJ20_17765 [Deltaproteobacteria bacterium]|nr:hypothetical protein [Deltaproteobacteria bacterium]
MKKTGGRLGSLPPEETADQYCNLKNSISRPGSGTSKAGLEIVSRVGDNGSRLQDVSVVIRSFSLFRAWP